VALPPDEPEPAEPVALWTLRQRPFVLPEPGTALRATVTAACEAAGFGPVPMFEVGEPASVRFLVHAGLGVSLVPASWLVADGPRVTAAHLAEPAPRHRLFLLAPDAGLTPAASMLYEALRDGYAETGGLELGD
jgi:DNA-binding transcriptional LysR family regulator